MFLRNNTLLPVQWKLSGLDVLGNDFSFNQENGVVQPKSEFELKVHFRASKANNYKRALKLEVLQKRLSFLCYVCLYIVHALCVCVCKYVHSHVLYTCGLCVSFSLHSSSLHALLF